MLDARLVLLREMAEAVSRVVNETSSDKFGAELGIGADGTPTKMVDDLAEREILGLLRKRGKGIAKGKATPDAMLPLNLLSEEAGYVDLGGERLLVADPIDGTTNAVRGIPFYCVSLAIGHKTLADVEVGLVVNLATGDRFEAIAGRGATLNGRPIRVRPEDKELVVASTAPNKGVHRSLGASALEMSLVASGALDGYHFSKPILRIIDVAASTLIVREAGGVVLDRSGKDLELPLSLAPRFGLTAASSRELAGRIGGTEK